MIFTNFQRYDTCASLLFTHFTIGKHNLHACKFQRTAWARSSPLMCMLRVGLTWPLTLFIPRTYKPGWPDWAIFRLLGDCLLWTVSLKMTKVTQFFWATLSTLEVIYLSWQKWAGLHFGRFFYKPIWSPWHARTLETVPGLPAVLHAPFSEQPVGRHRLFKSPRLLKR
jgi:hypothetical protein